MSRVPRFGALIVVALALAGCALENALVDGSCRGGYVLVSRRCVAEEIPSETTDDDVTPPLLEAGISDAGPLDDEAGALPPPIVGPGTTFPSPDAASPDAAPPQVEQPTDAGPPPLVCADDLVACRGTCISVVSDGFNCGACGKICPSNICVAGECVGTVHGDIVAFGQDFSGVPAEAVEARALVNAVMIATTDPIRLLSFEAGADQQTTKTVNDVIVAGVRARGRGLVFGHTGDPSMLEAATLPRQQDVVLVHGVPDDELDSIAQRWAAPLMTFAKKGGIVIVLDAGTARIPTLLSFSGLLPIDGHALVPPDTSLRVAVQGDVVGSKLPSPFAPFGNAVSFDGAPAMSNDLAWVVRTEVDGGLGAPVVIHRTVR